MLHKYLLAFLLLVSTAFPAFAQLDTIRIDLGASAFPSAAPWNNLTDEKAGAIEDLLNQAGLNTGISVAVTDAFNGNNTNGLPANDSLSIVGEASRDSFFGSKVPAVGGNEITGGVTFSGLDPNTAYSFGLFASREATDNRETTYTVEGATSETVSLNAASNVDSMARVHNLYPSAEGTIVVTATTGVNNNNPSGYYYLGVIEVAYVNTAGPGEKMLTLLSPNGGEWWEEGAQPQIQWRSTNVATVDISYSTDNGLTWNEVASDIPGFNQSYTWTVPGFLSAESLVRVVDSSEPTVGDTSDAVFSIVGDDPAQYTIVVIGSSTAAGTGPSSLDSAWVWRYRNYLTQMDTRFQVINLAQGGFTTYNVLPTGTAISGVSQSIDTARNITKAVSFVPDAIIVNLPSNDAVNSYSVADQLANYDLIAQTADSAGASLWVTTTQPRDLTDAGQIQIQLDMRDSTLARFDSLAIDFWSGFAEEDGTLLDAYDSGDGIHLNDMAHRILFERVIAKNIYNYVLDNPNPNDDPVTSLRTQSRVPLHVYPNPAADRLQVSVGATEGAFLTHLRLVNALGQTVAEAQPETGTRAYQVTTAGLRSGVYFLQVETTKGRSSAKVIVK
ncbi:Por secretion system C-terminal sorting domain-containing protein [Catalinimonas alkaloidigena]|uniref:Por secretion system C-terminal sorting domain-containing protein n=1 Tax=Catalinimonas alkaloidigena TaxID=1075417 RepID=A0A1G9PEG9_9BACT|nr:T9SS type A sorting domain-containing protein [Catalinimonas alkaloidigena]SDL96871.1 Por secretion system C-terminal sorting domain-containing protein [Catalinimonas alkaloidigena]